MLYIVTQSNRKQHWCSLENLLYSNITFSSEPKITFSWRQFCFETLAVEVERLSLDYCDLQYCRITYLVYLSAFSAWVWGRDEGEG